MLSRKACGKIIPSLRSSQALEWRRKAYVASSSSSFSTASSDTPNVEKLGVIGLGLMGHGIAQVAAMSRTAASTPVVAYESNSEFLDRGRSRIQANLDFLYSKGKLGDEGTTPDDIMNRLELTTDQSRLYDCDLIVEAIIENKDLKLDLYSQLGDACANHTIFASNTSSLSITEMALASKRPERFVGVHFFNPVQRMKLVEVIHTEYSDPQVVQVAHDWVTQDLGKVAVSCGDTPGFIVNRLLVPALMQAMLMIDRKEASVRDIDLSLQLGAGHPMGPLHLADYIGLDTCHSIVVGWTKDFPNEPAFVVPSCLAVLVEAGHLGRKSGRGFYEWDGEKRGEPVFE